MATPTKPTSLGSVRPGERYIDDDEDSFHSPLPNSSLPVHNSHSTDTFHSALSDRLQAMTIPTKPTPSGSVQTGESYSDDDEDSFHSPLPSSSLPVHREGSPRCDLDADDVVSHFGKVDGGVNDALIMESSTESKDVKNIGFINGEEVPVVLLDDSDAENEAGSSCPVIVLDDSEGEGENESGSESDITIATEDARENHIPNDDSGVVGDESEASSDSDIQFVGMGPWLIREEDLDSDEEVVPIASPSTSAQSSPNSACDHHHSMCDGASSDRNNCTDLDEVTDDESPIVSRSLRDSGRAGYESSADRRSSRKISESKSLTTSTHQGTLGSSSKWTREQCYESGMETDDEGDGKDSVGDDCDDDSADDSASKNDERATYNEEGCDGNNVNTCSDVDAVGGALDHLSIRSSKGSDVDLSSDAAEDDDKIEDKSFTEVTGVKSSSDTDNSRDRLSRDDPKTWVKQREMDRECETSVDRGEIRNDADGEKEASKVLETLCRIDDIEVESSERKSADLIWKEGSAVGTEKNNDDVGQDGDSGGADLTHRDVDESSQLSLTVSGEPSEDSGHQAMASGDVDTPGSVDSDNNDKENMGYRFGSVTVNNDDVSNDLDRKNSNRFSTVPRTSSELAVEDTEKCVGSGHQTCVTPNTPQVARTPRLVRTPRTPRTPRAPRTPAVRVEDEAVCRRTLKMAGTWLGNEGAVFSKIRVAAGDRLLRLFDREVLEGKLVYGKDETNRVDGGWRGDLKNVQNGAGLHANKDGAEKRRVTLGWNGRLCKTAGLTHLTRTTRTWANGDKLEHRFAKIELSEKVIDEPVRLYHTLAHEMCHAAAWIFDGVSKPPHGDDFKRWGQKFCLWDPTLNITTCHSYEIRYPFVYKCTQCSMSYGRHSRSIKTDKQVCGRCKGRLLLG